MTRARLLAEATSLELSEWQALYRLEARERAATQKRRPVTWPR